MRDDGSANFIHESMTDININDIDRLLQRFFDGFTTIEEEKALERFYASSPRLPSVWSATAPCSDGMPPA